LALRHLQDVEPRVKPTGKAFLDWVLTDIRDFYRRVDFTALAAEA
jgi:hypothetical protein